VLHHGVSINQADIEVVVLILDIHQIKFWMEFDSNETRLAPQIFVIRLRNMKFLGRAASDTDSRSQERNNIARIGRQHDTQDHPDFELTAR
jgi:hypothetical protein